MTLPTFFIIGAPRAGTTAMADYLREHPDVFIPPQKELYYFDMAYDRGEDWYRSLFRDVSAERAIGDATPTYLYADRALERMAATVPDAKLLVTLRNPVDRAYSGYWWQRALREKLTFDEIVRNEMAKGPRWHEKNKKGYLTVGRYLTRLQRVCDFFPRESLLVTLLEDMRRRPKDVFAEVCRFIGVDDSFFPADVGKVVNAAYVVRWPLFRKIMFGTRAWKRLPWTWADRLDKLNRKPLRYPPLDPELRKELLAWYAEDNAALARWLGRDLSMWGR